MDYRLGPLMGDPSNLIFQEIEFSRVVKMGSISTEDGSLNYLSRCGSSEPQYDCTVDCAERFLNRLPDTSTKESDGHKVVLTEFLQRAQQ